MLFSTTSLFAGLSALATLASAQSTLQFTSNFLTVAVGVPVTVTYTGGDPTQPVEIDLRSGPSGNLGAPTALTTSSTGGSFTWTPSTSLPSGSDYALQISQNGAINYWGPFTITGGTASSSASGSASTTSANFTAPLPTVSANSTTFSATTTVPLFTASSSGTGLPLSRNTTFSSATLTPTTVVTTPLLTTSSAPTSTSAAPAPSKSSSASRDLSSSSLAFVLTAVAAMICFH